jgi:hypothetical protein
LRQVESEVASLEQAWNNAVAAVKTAEVELHRAKNTTTAGAAGGAAAAAAGAASPADGAAPAIGHDDEKLKAMQSQLEELQKKVAAGKQASSQQAVAARKALDAALDAFQQQVSEAQGVMNDNPELAAYVKAAQQLQTTTRQLTEDLIRRQEVQFGRLMDLKDRLNESMEQRRIELWKNDAELQGLTERQAILTRQYNAAVGGGLKEAEEKKAELELVNNMVKARQDLYPRDSFYAEAIQQLQVIIDSTRKNIEEDRKKTEQLLTTLQQGFTSSQSIEKLPQEQKQLAETLQKQLAQINAARGQYNEAVDAAGAEDADAQMQTQIATLQAGIDARRKQLADQSLKDAKGQQEQQRLVAVQAKEAELSKCKEAEASARQAYFDKHRELRQAQAMVGDAKQVSEKINALIEQKDQAQRTYQVNVDQIEMAKRQADRAVEPLKPGDKDIVVRTGDDKRLLYTLASGGVILVVFAALILWTLHTASVEVPLVSIQAADLSPVSEQEQAEADDAPRHPRSNARGGADSDEDHQPAVV